MGDSGGDRFVVFRLGGSRCAAPAGDIREILPVSPATRIPGAPPAVTGLINVRGDLVTLVDGRRLLGVAEAEPPQTVVLFERAPRSLGIAVDDVLDLISVPAADLVDRRELAGVESRFVKAVARHGVGAVAVLDTEAILDAILPSEEGVL